MRRLSIIASVLLYLSNCHAHASEAREKGLSASVLVFVDHPMHMPGYTQGLTTRGGRMCSGFIHSITPNRLTVKILTSRSCLTPFTFGSGLTSPESPIPDNVCYHTRVFFSEIPHHELEGLCVSFRAEPLTNSAELTVRVKNPLPEVLGALSLSHSRPPNVISSEKLILVHYPSGGDTSAYSGEGRLSGLTFPLVDVDSGCSFTGRVERQYLKDIGMEVMLKSWFPVMKRGVTSSCGVHYGSEGAPLISKRTGEVVGMATGILLEGWGQASEEAVAQNFHVVMPSDCLISFIRGESPRGCGTVTMLPFFSDIDKPDIVKNDEEPAPKATRPTASGCESEFAVLEQGGGTDHASFMGFFLFIWLFPCALRRLTRALQGRLCRFGSSTGIQRRSHPLFLQPFGYHQLLSSYVLGGQRHKFYQTHDRSRLAPLNQPHY